jgi:hypothetical protein
LIPRISEEIAYTHRRGKHQMHDVVIVGVPLIAILAGTLFNNQALTHLETRLDGRLDRMQNEITNLRSEMHREFEQFYRTLGQHDAKIEILEKQQ